MIQIDNKFDVGQKVHMIGRRFQKNGHKRKPKWVVKSHYGKPLKVLCNFIEIFVFTFPAFLTITDINDSSGSQWLSYNHAL